MNRPTTHKVHPNSSSLEERLERCDETVCLSTFFSFVERVSRRLSEASLRAA
jgi:hypothetical protein